MCKLCYSKGLSIYFHSSS